MHPIFLATKSKVDTSTPEWVMDPGRGTLTTISRYAALMAATERSLLPERRQEDNEEESSLPICGTRTVSFASLDQARITQRGC
jgi:hypothetical protein